MALRVDVKREYAPERGSPEDLAQCERFALAVRQAMAINQRTIRGIGSAIGVREGTITKYLKGKDGGINPYSVNFGIIRWLAVELGVTMNQLDTFFQGGAFEGEAGLVDLDQVASWIRMQADAGDLPVVLHSLQVAAERMSGSGPAALLAPATLEPWTWPVEALEEAGVSERIRQRLGLDEETLDALVTEGRYNDEVVEALSIALNIDEELVRLGCEQRRWPVL